jgi:hypothetical protein
MPGFDDAKVDAEFFSPSAGNPPEFLDVKSNFLCNLGYGDASELFSPQSAPGVRRGVPIVVAGSEHVSGSRNLGWAGFGATFLAQPPLSQCCRVYNRHHWRRP